MTGIFANHYAKYKEAGYHVMPIRPKQKVPLLKGYPAFSHTPPTEEQYEFWAKEYPNSNIGGILGLSTGICVLDFDYIEKKLVDEIIEALVEPGYVADCRRKGSKNFALFFRYNSAISNTPHKWIIEGQTALEFFSDGRFIVLPPSYHPDTQKDYYWLEGCDPLYYKNLCELPLYPANGHEIISRIINKYHQKEIKKVFPAEVKGYKPPFGTTPFISEISTLALNNLDLWVPNFFSNLKKKDNGAYQGLPLYRESDNPTALSIHPTGIRDFSEVYLDLETEEMTRDRRYTAPGLLARAHPTQFPTVTLAAQYLQKLLAPEQIDAQNKIAESILSNFTRAPSADSNLVTKNASMQTLRNLQLDSEPQFPTHCLKAPNLLGEVYNYIIESARYKQPVLSLGGAITVIGGAIAQRLMTPTGLMANFFNLAIAPSGCGKEHIRQCVINLFEYIDEDQCLIERIGSGPGLIKALCDRKGEGVLLIDEFGRELSKISGKNADYYKSAILDELIKLASLPFVPVLKGTEYAEEKRTRKDIPAPCLNSYNTTVASHYYSALSSTASVDGFLGRTLIWETDNPNPHPDTANHAAQARTTPHEILLDRLKRLRMLTTNNENPEIDKLKQKYRTTRKNLTNAMKPDPVQPKIIPATEEATLIINSLADIVHKKKQILLDNEKGLEALWSRVVEQAWKLALVASDFETITRQEAQWAADLAIYQAELRTWRACTKVHDTEIEGVRSSILSAVRNYNKKHSAAIPFRHLQLSRGSHLRAVDLVDAIVFLIETEQIYAVSTTTNGPIEFARETLKKNVAFLVV